MRRAKFFLSQWGWLPVSAIALVLCVLGAAFQLSGFPNVSTILISVGGSLAAAALVTYLSPASDEVFQKFLSLGIRDVYPSRKDVPNNQWVQWVKRATQHCTLVGIAHEQWCRDPDFQQALEDRLRQGVIAKVFFLDPTSEIAIARAHEDKPRDTVKAIRDSIKFMWDFRNQLDQNLQNRMRLFVYAATLTGATWIDTFMIATHYLAGFANRTSPALMVRPVPTDQDLYRIYAHNITVIEETSATEITPANVHKYIDS